MKQVGVAVMVAAVVACGGKGQRDAEQPAWIEEDARESEPEAMSEPGPEVVAAEVSPDGPVLIAGHAEARYQFVVPAGLVPLGGMLPPAGHTQAEVSAHGPGAVGIPGQVPIAFDAVGVFSDPSGFGIDLTTASAAERTRLVDLYGGIMLGRFPSASPARLVTIGPHLAIRVDMPRVEMADRPLRSGRHYAVLDGRVLVSVDCLWTAAYAEQFAAACDAVTASLRRHQAAAP